MLWFRVKKVSVLDLDISVFLIFYSSISRDLWLSLNDPHEKYYFLKEHDEVFQIDRNKLL